MAQKQLDDDDEWMAFVVAAWPIWMLRDFAKDSQGSLRIIGENRGLWTVEPLISDEGGTGGDD